MDSKRLGRELRWLRTTLGYSQAEVAARIDVSQATYSRWESGKLTPGVDDLMRLSRLAGTGFGTLLRLLGVPVEDQTLSPGQWLDRRRSEPVKEASRTLDNQPDADEDGAPDDPDDTFRVPKHAPRKSHALSPAAPR